MGDTFLIAGGDNERRLELANRLNLTKYNVKVYPSVPIIDEIEEQNTVAFLFLYPAEAGVTHMEKNSISKDKPVICISTSPMENNCVRSLGLRANEFLIEPVSISEITAIADRLASLSSRIGNRDVLTVGDLTLNRTTLCVTLRNTKLPLYPLLVRILEFLMMNPGRVVTRQEISKQVWAKATRVDERTIDVSIGRIRAALRHKVTVDPIRTVRSVGYSFNEHFADINSLPSKRCTMKKVW